MGLKHSLYLSISLSLPAYQDVALGCFSSGLRTLFPTIIIMDQPHDTVYKQAPSSMFSFIRVL